MFITKSPIFYGADGTEAGGNVAVDAANSPTGAQIDVTPRGEPPAPEIVQPASITEKPVRQSGVKVSKVDVAKELGLSEAPSDLIQKEVQRVRDEHGKFTKTPRTTLKKEEPKVAAVKLGEPTEPKKPEAAKPAPEPIKEAPKEPAKVKIGSEEKTTEEWEKHFKELADKATKAAEPAKPADATPAAQTEEAVAAEEKKVRDDWFTKTTAKYTPDQGEFDKMLEEGDAKKFGEFFARVEESTRQWMANAMRPHLDKLHGFDTQLNPILERDKQIAAYQAENEFLESNQDIKSHPRGLQTMREIAKELHDEYDIMQQIISNPNTPNLQRYIDRAKNLEQNFHPELVKEIKLKLNIGATPIAAPAAIIPPVPAVAKPRPTPPGGQLGGNNAPKKVSDQANQVAEMAARGFF